MKPEETEDAYYEGGMFFKPGFGDDEWEAIKQRLSVGSIISGKVVHQALFGVFIDAGLRFPVLMFVAEFNDKGRSLVFPDDFPELNSEMSGQFAGFNEDNRQIVIMRLGAEPHPDSSSSRASQR